MTFDLENEQTDYQTDNDVKTRFLTFDLDL